jgi:hypothetical protein
VSISQPLTMLCAGLLAVVVSPSAMAGSDPDVPPSSTAIPLLVVPSGDAAVDEAVRAGAGASAAIVDETAATSLLTDARAAGLACAPAEGSCWLRVAELGGHRGVVFVAGEVVTVLSPDGNHAASAMGRTRASWVAATRRAFGVAGELRVAVTPPTATVSVDGAPVVVDGGVAVIDVAAGSHTVVVAADGFPPATQVVSVVAGAVVGVPVVLSSSETTPPWAAIAPELRWGGIAVLSAGVVGAGVLLALGQGPYLACYGEQPPDSCGPGGPLQTTADTTAMAAFVVGAVAVVVGGGALAAGLVVD